MRILGIDPGTAILGYGIIDLDKNKLIEVSHGVILNEKEVKPENRLLKIYVAVKAIIEEYKPDEIAMEKLFFNKNVKTAISISEARGVIMLLAAQNFLKISNYTPLQVKQAVTAYGKASKKDVQLMVTRLLALDKVPKPDDAADALAVAICHSFSIANSWQLADINDSILTSST